LSFEGTRLSFQNCTIQRTRNSSVAAVILENQSSIGNLEFNGFGLQDRGSYSALRCLLNVEAGSIGELVIDSLNPANIEAPVESGGFSMVGTVSGAEVLATGWDFPDSVMADNVPYISASTGRPSIKIDGVVEPYP
jgi:hypothetical protein